MLSDLKIEKVTFAPDWLYNQPEQTSKTTKKSTKITRCYFCNKNGNNSCEKSTFVSNLTENYVVCVIL